MKKLAAATIALGVWVLVCTCVDAQTVKRKPGLWETEYTVSGGEADRKQQEFQQKLANMTPEQRARMEEMIKRQGVGFRGNTMVNRICLTPQDVADEQKMLLGKFQHDFEGHKCDQKEFNRSATEIRFHTVCESPRGVSEFRGRVYDITPTSMAMEMDTKTAKEGEMHIKQKTHWVSECNQK